MCYLYLFLFLTYILKEKVIYLCISLVPIAMTAKILHCKEEREKQREIQRERVINNRITGLRRKFAAPGAMLQITWAFGG